MIDAIGWPHRATIGLGLLLLSVPICSPVSATLGRRADSVDQDRMLMKGQRQSDSKAGYSIETIAIAGLKITQYVSSDGLVFAVTWRGTGAPDLKQLFGDYFDEYLEGVTAARRRTPRMRGPRVIRTTNLILERGGHSRYGWGRALLPDALPPGLSAEDIR